MRLRLVHHVLVSFLGLLPTAALAAPGDAASRLGLFIGLFLPLAYLAWRRGLGSISRAFLLAAVALGVALGLRAGRRGPDDSALTPVAWIAQPPAQWPQIVLTNDASFRGGHSPLKGASAFLLRTPDGRVLGATARHLIGEAGGVQPEIYLQDLDQVLDAWRMYPRTRPAQAVAMQRLALSGLDRPDLDWLLLVPRETVPPAGIEVLQVRQRPVAVGETVYLIGCPYSAPRCTQQVYAGRVVERLPGQMFRYEFKPYVNLTGFSGAPVIDAQGHLVGVMTVSFRPRELMDKHVEGGGQDVAAIVPLLRG